MLRLKKYGVSNLLISLMSAFYFVALVALAIQVKMASPGPVSQEILGLAIGNRDSGVAYLSGRRLYCTALNEGQPFNAKCRVNIAGQMLEIYARRNPPTALKQLGGSCQAFYGGKEWSCQIASRHVHVHWFAYLDESLGLNKSQLEALRRQYWIENLPESIFFRAFVVLSSTTMLVVMITFIRWRWSKARSKAIVVLQATVLSFGVSFATFIFSVFWTGGLWD